MSDGEADRDRVPGPHQAGGNLRCLPGRGSEHWRPPDLHDDGLWARDSGWRTVLSPSPQVAEGGPGQRGGPGLVKTGRQVRSSRVCQAGQVPRTLPVALSAEVERRPSGVVLQEREAMTECPDHIRPDPACALCQAESQQPQAQAALAGRPSCTVAGCTRKPHGIGLCSTHYERWRKRRPLDSPIGLWTRRATGPRRRWDRWPALRALVLWALLAQHRRVPRADADCSEPGCENLQASGGLCHRHLRRAA